jgi:hypothetical protein
VATASLAPPATTPPAAARRSRAELSADRPRGRRPHRGQALSATPVRRERPAESIAGFLAATSIFASLISLAWRPLRLILISILLALIAAAIGGRHARLAAFAAGIGALCFFGGMTIAILTGNPLW